MLAPITAFDSALTQNASVTLLKSALTKSLDLKSLRINTCKKGGGSPPPWHSLPQGHMRRAQQLGRERSEEHTSELQSRPHLVCRLLLEKKKNQMTKVHYIAAPIRHV